MAKNEMEQVTERTLNKGGILAELYFDMHSAKQEELQPIMTDLVNNGILKSPGVVYCYGSVDEPVFDKDMYSTSAKLTVLFQNFDSMVNVVFSYAPFGIDIKKPERDYPMKISDLQASLLSISQASITYSEYILNKILSPEEREKIQSNLKLREEAGKQLMGKMNKKKDEK
jgi:hypothetical protein